MFNFRFPGIRCQKMWEVWRIREPNFALPSTWIRPKILWLIGYHLAVAQKGKQKMTKVVNNVKRENKCIEIHSFLHKKGLIWVKKRTKICKKKCPKNSKRPWYSKWNKTSTKKEKINLWKFTLLCTFCAAKFPLYSESYFSSSVLACFCPLIISLFIYTHWLSYARMQPFFGLFYICEY